MKIGFIGFGNMGSALGLALKDNYDVYYYDINKSSHQGISYLKLEELLEKCEHIILAVKPNMYEEILKKYDFSNNIVVSIAAGITSSFMKKYVKRFVLTMPNTPSLIKMGSCAIVKNQWCTTDVENIFKTVGDIYYILEEDLASAICLTGSSPAYFFNFIDELSKAFPNQSQATIELAKVMKACAHMILEEVHSAEQLTNNVCSPNGTTIQAINSFKADNLEKICKDAIEKCYKKAREIEKK